MGGGAAGATPFLCNVCFNPNSESGVPKNATSGGGCVISGSYQQPHSGKGYLYQNFFKLSTASVAWRTYAQSSLTNTLISGKIYCVTYYVSLSNRANVAIDELSAYFDNGSIQSIAPRFEALATPQIKSPPGVFYMDTLNWMKVQGTFTATGNESYITLGNFRTSATTNYTLLCSTYGIAEYYVDDVSVIDFNLPAYAGPDKNILSGDSAFIGRPSEIGLECTWTNGTTTVGTGGGLWVKPITTTTYIVTQDICGNIKTDTVKIVVNYVGIKENSFPNLNCSIYPNPSNGVFSLEIFNTEFVIENTEIKIVNVLGQEIKKEKLISKKQKINLEELQSGIYYLQLVNKQRVIVVKKILKE